MKEDHIKRLCSDFGSDPSIATAFYNSASLENGSVFKKYLKSSEDIENHIYKLAHFRLTKFFAQTKKPKKL